MASQIDALMEPMCAGHALQVNPVKLTASPQGEIISDFVNFLEGHNFIFMPCGLMKMVFVEQGSLRNFTGLRVNDSPPNHAFARHFETNALQGVSCRFVERGDGFAVEIREDRNIHQLSCVVLKEDLKGFTEFIQVSRRHVKVLDFKIVVDLEHQHLADGVNAFENREIPPTVQHAAHFPNETGDIGVGLCENANGSVFTARTHQVVDLIGRTEEGFRFRNQRHHFGNPS